MRLMPSAGPSLVRKSANGFGQIDESGPAMSPMDSRLGD
jgi:hypothetical protein